MKLVKDIIQGAGYLEGYGNHPGTATMFMTIAITGLAGAGGGIRGFVGGAVLGALALIPVWCSGCISRARSYQRDGIRMFESLKD